MCPSGLALNFPVWCRKPGSAHDSFRVAIYLVEAVDLHRSGNDFHSRMTDQSLDVIPDDSEFLRRFARSSSTLWSCVRRVGEVLAVVSGQTGSGHCRELLAPHRGRLGSPFIQRAGIVELTGSSLARQAVHDVIIGPIDPATIRSIFAGVDLQLHRVGCWRTVGLEGGRGCTTSEFWSGCRTAERSSARSSSTSSSTPGTGWSSC